MDLLHHIYALILDGELYMAPIKSHPERVLDLGTGTGIWAMDFAECVFRLMERFLSWISLINVWIIVSINPRKY